MVKSCAHARVSILSIFYLLVLAISFIKHLQWCVLIVSTCFHRILQTVGAKGASDDLLGHIRNLFPVTLSSKVQAPLPKKHPSTSEWKDFLRCPCVFGCFSCYQESVHYWAIILPAVSQITSSILIYLPGFISKYLSLIINSTMDRMTSQYRLCNVLNR